MEITQPYLLILGIVLLLIQSRWFFYNKKHKGYEISLGRTEKVQNILWIFYGFIFLIGEILVVFSFSTILTGILVAIILSFIILPFFWGLIL